MAISDYKQKKAIILLDNSKTLNVKNIKSNFLNIFAASVSFYYLNKIKN